MNLKKLNSLNRVCEDLLRQNLSRPEGLAFPALHLLGPQLSQLEKYESTHSENAFRSGKYLAGRLFHLMAGLLVPRDISILWKKYKLNNFDHVLISHEVGAPRQNDDFYFGKLPTVLGKQKKRILILKINHLGWKYKTGNFIPNKKSKHVISVTLPGWADWKTEREIYNLVPTTLKKISQMVQCRNVYGSKIREALEKSSEKANAAVNLRIYFWIKKLLREIKPSTLFFTWEGHAWERLAIRAAREVTPRTSCIGYQHTVLFPNAIGPFRSLGKLHDPDEIWTVGQPNQQRLAKAWIPRGVKILTYGSPRHQRFGCHQIIKKKPLCIIAPEGILSEATKLFRFGKEVAIKSPDIQFIFRNHPVLPYSKVAKFNSGLQRLPPNVEITDHGKPGELSQASWFLYRGTSLVFEALAAGARPLYFGKKTELAVDPLEKLKVWKIVLNNSKNACKVFHNSLHQRASKNRKKSRKEFLLAREWANSYFMKENPQLLINLANKEKK